MIQTVPSRILEAKPAHYLNTGVTVAIMLAFHVIPAAPPITPMGMKVLGVFLGMLYGWLTSDKIATSLLGLVMLGLTGYCTVPEAFAKAFGNSTALLVFFFFMVAGIMNEAGVTAIIAAKMTGAEFVKKNPYLLMLMLCLTACVMNILVNGTAACMILYPLVKKIAQLYGCKPRDRWPALMIIGITYIGGIAYGVLPFYTISAIGFGAYEAFTGGSIPYGRYVLCMVSFLLVSIAAFLAYCLIFERKTVGALRRVPAPEGEDAAVHMTAYQKTVLLFFAAVIVLLLAPSLLPDSIWIVGLLKRIGAAPLVALSLAVYGFLRLKNGIRLPRLFRMSISWEVFFLLAAALAVAGAITAADAGIEAWAIQTVLPIISGRSSYLLILVLVLCCCFFTNITNHAAVAAIFAPVACTLSQHLTPGGMQGILVLVILASSIGLCTPAAGANSALVFGDTEWFTMRLASGIGLRLVLLHVLLILTAGYGLTVLFFGG